MTLILMEITEKYALSNFPYTHRKKIIQKRWQRSSLLFGGQNLFNSLPRYLFAPGRFEECDEFILFFITSCCKQFILSFVALSFVAKLNNCRLPSSGCYAVPLEPLLHA